MLRLKCTRTLQICNDPHPGYSCDLFIELFLKVNTSAIKKQITTVFLFQLQQFDYEI